MKERCRNKNYCHYARYGGRGIKVCDRWLGKDGFRNFLEDMGERPPKHTLNRIDNDGDYEPSNCKWATQLEQVQNSEKIFSAKVTKQELDSSPCSPALVYKRLRCGWDKEAAITIPPDYSRKKNHTKALESHNRCVVCGDVCPRSRNKYCCREHFLLSRGKDGRFERKEYNHDKSVKTTKSEEEKPAVA